MGSITSWSRLEPQSTDRALGSLAARIADPLWLMARQWQFGEWQGEDTGSPVDIRVRHEVSPFTRYAGGARGTRTGAALAASQPLDAIVEPERQPPTPDLRFAAMAGLRFLETLGATLAARYGPGYRERYAFGDLTAAPGEAADGRSKTLAALLGGRGLDGFALQAELSAAVAAGRLPRLPPIDAGDENAVTAAAKAWLRWWDRRTGAAGADAWIPDRLMYQFAVAAPVTGGEVVLHAPAHRGGRLDWTAFDVSAGESLGAAADAGRVETTFDALPTGLGFPGMPAPRWWQIENRRIDFGALDAAPDDLGRLLLAEFALVYGNDFFGLPLPLPVGSVCRILQIEVSTTFGERVNIPSVAAADVNAVQRWRMFQLSSGVGDRDSPGWLVLPAFGMDVHEGDPLEAVLFSRDEMSNLAWAVEQRITGPAGSAVDRAEIHDRATPEPAPLGPNPQRAYRLATPVPPHWLPLVPRTSGAGGTRLELRGLHAPLGRLLGAPFALASEELPRAGRLAERRDRRTRWIHGATHVWTARKIRSGRGESSAGLRFDHLESA
ncbi:MAG TPA: hypothetical protein VFK57_19035 [Vicinamibacterales bacterium]|nr:hypothetical protein [Vicinamibacterales bacterium]